MCAITEKHCKIFGEKVLVLANRGTDPVAVEALVSAMPSKPPHSVVKLLQDIFSRPDLATNFFYTNDLRVLFDVLIRELSDRSHGDPVCPAI